MKILYSIQATGNGHIARAIELMPFIQQYGEVDVFLSGSNNSLQFDLPVKYKSKGLSLFYGNRGGLDYMKMLKECSLLHVIKEARELPVEKYDMVINDFESITSLACKIKRVASVHFGHQASFSSAKTPRPAKKEMMGEFILKHYASSSHHIGLHFDQYDKDIYSPILKASVLNADPTNEGYVTVYLSHYSDEVVMQQLHKVSGVHFHLFSKKEKEIKRVKNVTLIPVGNKSFSQSMISSAGVITGAGFETPAEALYLEKKLLCLPILGQYEQLCNAAALEQFNVRVLNKIDDRFAFEIKMWLNSIASKPLQLKHSTAQVVELVMEKGLSIQKNSKLSPSNILTQADNIFTLPQYSV